MRREPRHGQQTAWERRRGAGCSRVQLAQLEEALAEALVQDAADVVEAKEPRANAPEEAGHKAAVGKENEGGGRGNGGEAAAKRSRRAPTTAEEEEDADMVEQVMEQFAAAQQVDDEAAQKEIIKKAIADRPRFRTRRSRSRSQRG